MNSIECETEKSTKMRFNHVLMILSIQADVIEKKVLVRQEGEKNNVTLCR